MKLTLNRFLLVAALGAFVVLGAASVWMGGLNQDEGWYLYAANLVSEGAMPYRDFFYTQGPLMPIVYSAFADIWRNFGLLGARIFTLAIGAIGIAFACLLARTLASKDKNGAMLVVFLLLATNLYHLYYLAIPKTYALAGTLVIGGMLLVTIGLRTKRLTSVWMAFAGLVLAFAAGTRISLGAILPVVGIYLLFTRRIADAIGFAIGGFAGLALVYGPFLIDDKALAGLLAAQKYHAARGGFDIVWTVGSVSRLVRWYLPVFVVLAMAWPRINKLLLAAFLGVFAVQMAAPFPYEDYQVPIMALLAVISAAGFADGNSRRTLLVTALCFGCSFGSPLLEKWSTNGQDRFWSLKKGETELAQLRRVAAEIKSMDPKGNTLLTQDTYLAIETNRKVPWGLEMGPFSMMDDADWRKLLTTADCEIAALSGYSFAIVPPKCEERPMSQQMEFWGLLKQRYELLGREENFGQNATTLLILKRKK